MIDEQKEIAKHYGLEHQLLKLVEELGEAQTEVGRYLQGERADRARSLKSSATLSTSRSRCSACSVLRCRPRRSFEEMLSTDATFT